MKQLCFAKIVGIGGWIALTQALFGCGDAPGSAEEPQASLTQTVTPDTARRAPNKLPTKFQGYEVVVIDWTRATHEPKAINNRGQIVGSVHDAVGRAQAWFWDGEQEHFLVTTEEATTGVANDLNDAGSVVGAGPFFRNTSDDFDVFRYRTRAFIYDGETVTDFPISASSSMSRAEGINRHGDVVGTIYGGSGSQYAVWWRGEEIIEFGVGRAMAINDRRQAVGSVERDNNSKAFLSDENGEVEILGTLGGEYSYANDLNERGEVVGYSGTTSGEERAFLYRDGAMLELTVPGERIHAEAINERGQIVGSITTFAKPWVTEGFVYQDGQARLLLDIVPQDGCWMRLEARDINDHGDILGIGTMNDYATCGGPGRYLIVITRRPGRYR
jgi:probable HAF family extracellular repeat protein